MTGELHGRRLVAATGTLALLNEQADAVRAELSRLRQEVADVQRGFNGMRAAQLQEANEQLILAALNAESIAEAAVSNLGELARSGPHEPHLRDLREANEQLVLAASSDSSRRRVGLPPRIPS